MIPHKLENAILNGWATFQTVSHAFSAFGTLPMPENSTVIITSIKWFPFLNPITIYDNEGEDITTWRDYFRYNEYQLKIDSKKSTNFLQFRNENKWRWFPDPLQSIFFPPFFPLDLDTLIDYPFLAKNFLPEQGRPIQQDVYFVCEEFIKLSITRNCFIDKTPTLDGLLQPVANEEDAPSGLKNTTVLLRAELFSASGQSMFYFPATPKLDGNDAVSPRKVNSYTQDIDPVYSQLDTIGNSQLSQDFPYQTSPLVEFGIVTIDNNYWDKIHNS